MRVFTTGSLQQKSTIGTMRRAFTLVEMLVASMVFITGFVAVFTLFLAGTKLRAQGDMDTRSAIAIRNLTEEIQLDAGVEGVSATAPFLPQSYVGSGFPTTNNTSTSAVAQTLDDGLFSCPGLPGLFYRVIEVTDGVGEYAGNNPVLNLRVIILGFSTGPRVSGDELKWSEVDKRLGIRAEMNGTGDTAPSTPASAGTPPALAYLIHELVRRGIATDNRVAIIRQPSWLRP